MPRRHNSRHSRVLWSCLLLEFGSGTSERPYSMHISSFACSAGSGGARHIFLNDKHVA
jgi:hypothetical protein